MALAANRPAVLTLYSDPHDPVGHIVRYVLAEKDITADVQFITDETRPEDLYTLNPYRSLLTLIDRELVLYDPGVMLEYLDERYPHPPMMPIDPLSRANHRQIRARIMHDLYAQVSGLSGPEQEQHAARAIMRDMLTAIAPAFTRQRFFFSDELMLADCCLAPLLWRLPSWGVSLPGEARPIARYAEQLFARQGFQAALSPAERRLR